MNRHLATFQDSNPEFIAKLKSELYVDNLISGANSLEEAKALCENSYDIFLAGNFKLRKWKSNFDQLNEFMRCKFDQKMSNESVTKVLGTTWDISRDEFIFDLTFLNSCQKSSYSKRDLLSIVGQIYDPLGFLSPLMLLPKLLFQQICKAKGYWDSKLDSDTDQKWKSWLKEARTVNWKVPRNVLQLTAEPANVSFHGFCDASSLAYAAAVYMKITYPSGLTQCFLLIAKSRIAPAAKPQ